MKDTVKYAFILAVVGSICASLVVVTYNFAQPILTKREEMATKEALDSIYEDNVYYANDISDSVKLDKYLTLKNLYEVELTSNTVYVYKISTAGKNGNIVYLLEIDKDGKVLNIEYVSQSETPGRGDKITLESFTSQVINSSTDSVEIDAISGATISSSAMINSVKEALLHFENEVK